MDDWSLLIEYVKNGSEAAFEQIVRRYTSLVYSSAVRRAGQEYADDVAQAVFIVLARKASSLQRKQASSLAGWLYRATQFAASEALRSARRRKDREQSALEKQQMLKDEQHDSKVWEHMKPVLDPVLDSLSASDREAVLLRFFQGASLAEVGDALNISENTATKRVARALNKMRKQFGKKGIMLTLPMLTAFLSSTSAEAASIELAVPALLSATTAGSALADGTAKVMLISQIKTTTAVVIASLSVSSGLFVAADQVSAARAKPVRVVSIVPFSLRYKARTELPDGTYEFQINTRKGSTTHFAKLGDTIDGFEIVGHELKSGERMVPGISTPLTSDISELILKHGDRRIVLAIDKHMRRAENVALLVSRDDGSRHKVCVGDTITICDIEYFVKEINFTKERVVLRNIYDSREISIHKK